MDLADNSIIYFLKKVRSIDSAVPAGASTSALTGASGIALLELVLKVSVKYLAEEERKNLLPIQNRLEELEVDMLQLMEEDVKVYQLNQSSNFKDKNKLQLLIEIPLKIARKAAESLELEKQISPYIKSRLSSDLKTAKFNLKAALKGSLEIVKANLENFELLNSEYKKNIAKEIEKLDR